ncbi:MAG: hypothetical protein ABIZ91_04990 [Gemmatimonadaceae bacterium]
MMRYRVFGGVFAAPFAFPELRSEPEGPAPDWNLRVAEGPLPSVPSTTVGREQLAAGVEAQLQRTGHGLRLTFDDTGTFDILRGGSEIEWYPASGSDPELVRVDIIGRVLAAASHEQGLLCLHGSAVSIDRVAVGFLAPKGSGKSTLAMALASQGARLLTDDTLPVEPHTCLARPGVHSVRLWNDAAERFASLGDWRLGLSDKRTFDALPDSLIQHDAVPLAALYELVPSSSGELPGKVQRTQRVPAHGAVTLVQHSKLGALLGGAESLRVFDACASIAAAVPVYQLDVTRALDAVDEVAATIMRWHR